MDASAGSNVSYQLVQRLASGGMGEVFLARADDEGGSRPVVIKKVHPRWAHNEDVMSLFRDEARLGAALEHPNVVRVVDYGRSGEGTYLVLEYVEGRNFAELISAATEARRYLPAEVIAWIGLQACRALDHIHHRATRGGDSLGVVHRDINPANLLIGYRGEVKLTDFGVAAGLHRELRTAHGILRGTFPYMSPEQTRCLPVDGRSDLFSLGIVLYEGLTAHHPFADDEDYLTIKAIQEEVPPAPHELRRDLDPALSAIIMRVLQKDPDDRQANARALHDDLLHWLRSTGHALGPEPLQGAMAQYFPQRRPAGDRVDAAPIRLHATSPGRQSPPLLDLSALDLRSATKRVGGAITPSGESPRVERPEGGAAPDVAAPAPRRRRGSDTDPEQSLSDSIGFEEPRRPSRREVAPPPPAMPAPLRATATRSFDAHGDFHDAEHAPISLDRVTRAPARRPRTASRLRTFASAMLWLAILVASIVFAVYRFT